MDLTGAIAAAMEAVSSQHPIREGEIMLVRVDVFADHQLTGERKRATTGYLTMVALDAAGKPTPAPRLLIETEEERAVYEAAEHVRDAALRRSRKQAVGSRQ
jgi:hypothetical protein